MRIILDKRRAFIDDGILYVGKDADVADGLYDSGYHVDEGVLYDPNGTAIFDFENLIGWRPWVLFGHNKIEWDGQVLVKKTRKGAKLYLNQRIRAFGPEREPGIMIAGRRWHLDGTKLKVEDTEVNNYA